jgi:stage V sporulation protein R
MNLPSEIDSARKQIETYAREYGLDFHDVVFEILDYDQLNEVASYGGFPTRYPHWRFGMDYEELAKSHSYGLSRIYELVINNNPVYAYLMKANAPVEQKLVMAHVFGHADFFKNNFWFSKTNRRMIDEMANHATRVRSYIDRHGVENVEDFIDACLSLENLIDYHSEFIERQDRKERLPLSASGGGEEEQTQPVPRLKSKPYMERYINPPSFLEEQKARLAERAKRKRKVPAEPQRDILQFLIEHAPLDNWERDVLSIVREEAYYFAPQGMTKVMNEGWASFWHSTIMTQRALTDSEVVDFADHHSGTLAMSPGRFNPYKIGIELFREIEERWNKGKFGKDYEECDDLEVKRRWDRNLGMGRQKIFEVRKIYNDVTFIDAFMTEEFCHRLRLYTYGYDSRSGRYVIVDRDWKKVKDRLLFSLTNMGNPIIHVVDGNHGNRGELYLKHRFEGIPLDVEKAKDTLKNLHRIWRRPAHVETMDDDRGRLLSYDGSEHKSTRL